MESDCLMVVAFFVILYDISKKYCHLFVILTKEVSPDSKKSRCFVPSA